MPQMVFKRYEIKYRLTSEQRSRLVELLASHMEPDAHGPSIVRNIYYDTPTHLLVRRSSESPAYKEKLRIRSYRRADDATPVFLELKKKFAGVVYKRRVTLSLADADATLRGKRRPESQIEREIAFAASRYVGLSPAMLVAYDREAYYAPDDRGFRVTFDRLVRCRWSEVTLTGDCGGHSLLDKDTSLMELKCAGAFPLWMVSFLTAERIHKRSFSKYGAAWRLQQALEKTVIWDPSRVAPPAQTSAISGAGPPASSPWRASPQAPLDGHRPALG